MSLVTFQNHTSNGVVDEFDFDSLQPKPVPFKWKGKNYLLREASHAKAIEYRSVALGSYQVIGTSYLPGKDFPRMDIKLLFGCVFLLKDDGTESLVSEKELSEWPYRVSNKLFDRLREMSSLADVDLTNPDVLRKEISRLQGMLDELLERKKKLKELTGSDEGEGGTMGNSPESTTTNSS